MMTPIRVQAKLMRSVMENPWLPINHTQFGRTMGAGIEMLERATRRFERPEFGLDHTKIDGKKVKVTEEVILDKPFCKLLHFKRKTNRNDPKVLVCAPMSGHFATLLRGTVEALLPHHDVYITDWEDARLVPLAAGHFDLDSCIAYIREFIDHLGPKVHVMAVCQPAVPVLAAVSVMATENHKHQPATMTLMGGPVDTRVSKTTVTELAETRDISWFEQAAVHTVPFPSLGAGRRVYPGFLQLNGFMSMNLDLHVGSHMKFFKHLVDGDGESADKHKKFYNEYLAVMDIPAEFYLQTVETVFQEHSLPRGTMIWTNPDTGEKIPVRPQDIEKTALLTVEGEKDDISARGQTTAAHDLCYSLPQRMQFHHFQLECGHYGIFNGRRWRGEIMPRMRWFMRKHDTRRTAIPKNDLKKVPNLEPERYNRDKHGIAAIRRWLKKHSRDNYREVIRK